MYQLTVSIVLYHNDDSIKKLINSILRTKLNLKLYLIDNSFDDSLQKLDSTDRIEYIYNNANLGYGNAHNIAIQKAKYESCYHLIVNPDIHFVPGTIEQIFTYMENNPDVGLLMPKVLYEDGEIQRLCKLLPTPINLIGRRFFRNSKWAKKLNDKYELNGFFYDKEINIPCLSGCFMFGRNEILQKVGGFDSRYFMYLEDYDLVRRIHKFSKTIFYPHATVYHGFKKESYDNPILLKHHIQSAIKYFNKWGWIWDNERRKLNQKTLSQIQ